MSLADDFDQVLEEDGVYKSYSLYKEKRFTKLGYTAGAIYDCLPQFRKVLERTHKQPIGAGLQIIFGKRIHCYRVKSVIQLHILSDYAVPQCSPTS